MDYLIETIQFMIDSNLWIMIAFIIGVFVIVEFEKIRRSKV